MLTINKYSELLQFSGFITNTFKRDKCNFFEHFVKIQSSNSNLIHGDRTSENIFKFIKELTSPLASNFSYIDYLILFINHYEVKRFVCNSLIFLGLKDDVFYIRLPIGFKSKKTLGIGELQFIEILYMNGGWIVNNKKVFNVNNYLLHSFMQSYSSYISENLNINYRYKSIDKNYIENTMEEHSKLMKLLLY
jgi:hypothetical protein